MRIEAYIDVMCPWCYIGKRRLETALAELPGRERVEVVWRSLELAPDSDRTPGPTAAEAMVRWRGAAAPARVALIHETGAAEGLEIDLRKSRPVNTFDAHRLIKLGADAGRADETLEVLYRAYHSEGLDIADHGVLTALAAEAGLPAADARAMLAGEAYGDAVRADESRARALGVQGVPTLVIGDAPPTGGVQPPATLRHLIERALRSRSAGA
ncbi:DsbA family oxidoreductase [Bailinhaonella thermotolerans]|uniref:DsbA family oxidoreductase n=1 Tax=Bailinhaonella thermotolerans TaxID=1070861 RepID=A0A3A4BTB1_9ACTN|nr:DsbA family oxidoreductase [Bailinhaonella thermotolerans]RJL34546.1 DsbA family oxidoreductase [Bailinhaonella thermotolerans]